MDMGLGPFTTGLLLLVAVFGFLLIVVVPWIMLIEMWAERKNQNVSGEAWLLVPAWALITLAFTLDWVWYGLKWMIGW